MTLATIADLRKLFVGKHAFPVGQDEYFEERLALAEEYVRVTLANSGRFLDLEVEDGRLSRLIVSDIICQLVKRSYTAAVGDLPEASQISQTAGPYSMNFSPISSGEGLYLRKEERAMLGLGRGRTIKHVLYRVD